MRDWDEIVSEIALEEGVTKAEADVIYHKPRPEENNQ
jgi:hypothetical protein